MRDDGRSQRQEQIERAAYAVLEQKGYVGTSMQGIARAARASNETLYNWYGDKRGLFKALVARNAADVRALLAVELSSGQDGITILGLFGPRLLELLLGDRAVALNRAAAADPSGELGLALSEAGRESVLPLLEQVLEAARQSGDLSFESTGEAVALYLDLLIGDLQIRRVIGRIEAPAAGFCADRAARAVRFLGILLGCGNVLR